MYTVGKRKEELTGDGSKLPLPGRDPKCLPSRVKLTGVIGWNWIDNGFWGYFGGMTAEYRHVGL